MDHNSKTDVLKRLAYVEGHLAAVRRMIEEDTYCVDVLKQMYAVRRGIEKAEAKILDGHLHHCVLEAVGEGRQEEVFTELLELYEMANR
ncbi:MAG: metal-sensitive transcriptional regulator [Dehalococcoidia bacterium]|nr:metal-sensitive transcriptional regulator [Dehalococcoidia bacterium]MCA9850871.1 metal-sensitive transcriptional regulator [Dehalococcoidia bacterium]MCA9856116.1 metal-sensitive transcriptional regulator [Dehalococcoidia bacterium]MCB9483805.1 metal-sensitive transcriptional regulator [Dehalococcoidia bacterium]